MSYVWIEASSSPLLSGMYTARWIDPVSVSFSLVAAIATSLGTRPSEREPRPLFGSTQWPALCRAVDFRAYFGSGLNTGVASFQGSRLYRGSPL